LPLAEAGEAKQGQTLKEKWGEERQSEVSNPGMLREGGEKEREYISISLLVLYSYSLSYSIKPV